VTWGWRKLHNEEVYNLYSYKRECPFYHVPDVSADAHLPCDKMSMLRDMKKGRQLGSNQMRWVGHAADMEEKVYTISLKKLEGNRPPETLHSP
jgi:hypothetical protein